MRTTIDRLGLALLLAWSAVPAVTAQERGAPQPGETGQAAPARGGGKKAEQDKPERAAAPPGRGNPANRDAVVGEMKDAEVRHRERLAMIDRLRALATSKGQTERLAALDKLQAKENERYERHLEKQSGKLGDDQYRKVKERLAKGREKAEAKSKGKPVDRPSAPDAKPKQPDRPADGQAQDKGKERDKDKQPKAGNGDGKGKGGKPKLESRS